MLLFKISPEAAWREAERSGLFEGAPVDLADGFIHLSDPDQVVETAAKHFAGQSDLLLIAFDADGLGPELKWEPSRGGALFPHLYRTLAPNEAVWALPLELDPSGVHIFPPEAGLAV